MWATVQVVVGKKLDDVFMVMEFMEHDLKGLMEERDSTNPLFAMSEVSSHPHPPPPLHSPPSSIPSPTSSSELGLLLQQQDNLGSPCSGCT